MLHGARGQQRVCTIRVHVLDLAEYLSIRAPKEKLNCIVLQYNHEQPLRGTTLRHLEDPCLHLDHIPEGKRVQTAL